MKPGSQFKNDGRKMCHKKQPEGEGGISTFSMRCTAQPNVTEPFTDDEGCTRQLPKTNDGYRDDR